MKRACTGMVAIVTAIFLVFMLAALALAMGTLSSVQSDTTVKSFSSTNVYYGAKAGLDWGIQRAIAAASCAASSGFAHGQGSLSGVAVTVTCSASAHGASTVYYLTSTATFGALGSPQYAERRLEATVSNLP